MFIYLAFTNISHVFSTGQRPKSPQDCTFMQDFMEVWCSSSNLSKECCKISNLNICMLVRGAYYILLESFTYNVQSSSQQSNGWFYIPSLCICKRFKMWKSKVTEIPAQMFPPQLWFLSLKQAAPIPRHKFQHFEFALPSLQCFTFSLSLSLSLQKAAKTSWDLELPLACLSLFLALLSSSKKTFFALHAPGFTLLAFENLFHFRPTLSPPLLSTLWSGPARVHQTSVKDDFGIKWNQSAQLDHSKLLQDLHLKFVALRPSCRGKPSVWIMRGES